MPADNAILADLTPDQAEAVQHIDGPLLILAGAGSGKTRVITRRVAWLLQNGVKPWSILAITFTNKAAQEMKQRVEQLLPGNRVWVSTFHSFGARIMRQYAEHFGLDKNFTIYDMDDRAKVIKVAMAAVTVPGGDNFTPDRIGGIISKAKNQLWTPELLHRNSNDFVGQFASHVYSIYQKKLKAANAVDFDDLLLMPALALQSNEDFRQTLDDRFKYILIDEYQDTNAAQYIMARFMSQRNQNICVVGDPDQCVLPGTLIDLGNGKTRKIEKIVEGEEVASAIGWGKTRPRPVEKVMESHYAGPVVRIQFEGGSRLRLTPNHICFGRLRPDPNLHYVYLMYKQGMGYRLGTTRGVRTSKDSIPLSGLMVRTNQEVADAMWIIRTCHSAAEARYLEHFFSVKYGIPTMVFFVRGRRMAISQDYIDRLYREVDTVGNALRLMNDLHINPDYPHHRPGAVVRGERARRYMHITLFGDAREKETDGRWHEHRVQLVTSGGELRKKVKDAGFPVREGNRGTWRVETSRKGYDDAHELASSIAEVAELDVIQRARLTKSKSFVCLPASHLQPGMIVPVCEKGTIVERIIDQHTMEEYSGPVYDLSIPETRNFVAGGLVVHNSVYAWRGANIRNILDFEKDFPKANVITLDRNYRSTKAILHAASTLIERNKNRKKKGLVTDNPDGEPVRVLTFDNGLEEADGIARAIKQKVAGKEATYRDFAVFVRMNALTRALEQAFLKLGIPYQIVKGLAFFERKENKDVIAYLRLLLNPADSVSFLRAVNEPTRGIGKVSLEHLQAFAEQHEISLLSAAANVEKIASIKGKAAKGLKDFAILMHKLRGHIEEQPDQIINLVLDASGYRDMLKTGEQEDDERLANVEELITAARQFYNEDTERTLGDFLENITLASDTDGWDNEQDHVSVMTLHASKGLEFPIVYILAVEEGILPHQRSMEKEEDVEEERRLAFVGMTRAMRELYLCNAKQREFRGQVLYAIPSSFLKELPEEVERKDMSVSFQRVSNYSGYGASAPFDWNKASFTSPSAPAKPSPVKTADTHSDELAAGQIVQHEGYGIGQILDVSGYGALRKVKIRFATNGDRTFVADKVKLKIVKKK